MQYALHSFMIAAVLVGPVFYVSFVEASVEHRTQLAHTMAARESVAAVIAEEIAIEDGGNFTPLWQRERYLRIVPEEAGVKETEKAEQPSTVSEATTAAVEEPVIEETKQVMESVASLEIDSEQAEPVEEPETTEPQAPYEFADALSREIAALVNDQREAAGLSPLKADAVLTQIATGHSEHMVADDFFAHADPKGCKLSCRLSAHDYTALAWAENIAVLHKSDLISVPEIAEHIVESWMGSGGHRENILTARYTHTGIGIAYDGTSIYATMDYAEPK